MGIAGSAIGWSGYFTATRVVMRVGRYKEKEREGGREMRRLEWRIYCHH